MGRIAITGTASFLGARLLRRLVDARGPDAVLAVDIAAPPATLAGVRYRMVDLTLPGADQRLLDAFQEEEVETVVHCAFFTDPRRDTAYAHELESIGTLNLVAAAAAAGVPHVVMRSFSALYGADGQNPNFLTEEHPLRASARLPWLRDKVEAEQHAQSYGRRFQQMRVTVLRLAPLVGPGVYSFYTRLFSRRVVNTMLGYDPLVQLLHPEDALDAFGAALRKGIAGVFNVVPRSTMTLLTVLHLADKVTVPLPHPLAYALADFAWASGVGEAPGGFLDYVRYLCVADGDKARRELGFEPRYGSRDALMGYLAYRYPRRYLGQAEAEATSAAEEVRA
ncbi:MAG: NAD-dependent epimerase/dehydratase family protein [Vicinamibacteria bacterium]